MGVDVLLVSQRLVDVVDGWDALRNIRAHTAHPPDLWVLSDGDASSVASYSGLAARVIGVSDPMTGQVAVTSSTGQTGHGSHRALVLVIGSKGGVGKTLVTANVSARLASCGFSVAALDLDFESGDLSLRLGLPPSLDLVQANASVATPLVDGWATTDRALPLTLFAAPARPELAALASQALVGAIVDWAQKKVKVLMVDTPSDPDNELLYTVLESASNVLLVTTLAPGAVRQARVTLELLKRLNYPVRDRCLLVLNRVSPRTPLTVRDAADLVGHEPRVILPEAGRRADLESYRGRPTVLSDPRSRLARSIGDLVASIWPEASQPKSRGFVRFLTRAKRSAHQSSPLRARGF
jgi:MinD-like ATPase involved in chromosome partitioning or flagellar assembly